MKLILLLVTASLNFPHLLNAQVSANSESLRNLNYSDSAFVSEYRNVEFTSSYSGNDTTHYIRLPKYTPRYRRSYLGFTVGALIPTRASANNQTVKANTTCVNFDLGNISYLFTPHFGVTALFHVGFNNNISRNSLGETWTMFRYIGVRVGPFYSQRLSDNMHFDIRMMGGYFLANMKRGDDDVAFSLLRNRRVADGFSVSGGVVLRYNFSRKSALMANIDYFSSIPSFKDPDRYNIPVRAITVGVGVAFRIP